MKYFNRAGKWLIDRREESISINREKRQIDKIRNSLPCSVAEAFSIIGVFFDSHFKRRVLWNKHLKEKILFQEIQRISNQENKSFFILCFDDDSPVVFKGPSIILFEDEEELDFTYDLIMKKMIKINSNVSIKKYQFKPD